ncbi:MAG TPA: amidohydrolase family protein, partial [Candidatus Glassbacteria bacterium]|nr:amidohydrolase family protein [Candidatus Glassbacteria bacterium]
ESASRLEILAETGFSGVKLHPPICHFSLDVDRDAAFYTTLERLSLPLLIHTGVLSGYMHWPLEYYHPLLIDKLAGRHPGIPIIMAHCGGAAFCRDVLAVVQNHGQAYIDLTHSLDPKYAWYVPKSEYELIFNTVGPGRVIFGVDYPWYAPEEFERDLKILESLGISGRDLDRVLSENFLGLLENKPG